MIGEPLSKVYRIIEDLREVAAGMNAFCHPRNNALIAIREWRQPGVKELLRKIANFFIHN